jgi:hypothetical protein
MTKITFDEPSAGNVNSVSDGLAVVNQGRGNGISGHSHQGGAGLQGSSDGGPGIHAESRKVRVDEEGTYAVINDGVFGLGKNGVHGQSASATDSGVWGENTGAGQGVRGTSAGGIGVHGVSIGGGHAGGTGVNGVSVAGIGVWGKDMDRGFGVKGESTAGAGVMGESKQSDGVLGKSHSNAHAGLSGVNDSGGSPGYGVWGSSQGGEGVHGESNSITWAGVTGIQVNPNSTAPGVWGESRGKGPAAVFKGDVEVTGDIRLVNQDCAEDFDTSGAERIEPGTVMVIENENALQVSSQAHDKRVAGVVSPDF